MSSPQNTFVGVATSYHLIPKVSPSLSRVSGYIHTYKPKTLRQMGMGVSEGIALA